MRRLAGVVLLTVLLGCSGRATAPLSHSVAGIQDDGPVPQPTTVGVLSALTPNSVPLVPVVTPDHQFRADASGKFIFTSQAELERFLGQDPERSSQWPTVDFDQYTAVGYVSELDQARAARIVGVDEWSDRLVVHTVQWLVAENAKAIARESRWAHVVLVPRTSKQIVFAETLRKTLVAQPLMPSPQVGVPSQPRPTHEPHPDEHPRWKPVPNPQVNEQWIENQVRQRLGDSTVESLTVEKVTVEVAQEKYEMQPVLSYLPGAEVWVAVVNGELAGSVFPGAPTLGGPERFSELMLTFAVDDGMGLGSHGKPL